MAPDFPYLNNPTLLTHYRFSAEPSQLESTPTLSYASVCVLRNWKRRHEIAVGSFTHALKKESGHQLPPNADTTLADLVGINTKDERERAASFSSFSLGLLEALDHGGYLGFEV